MRDRCYDPSVESFKDYGAKGIRVCDEWNNSFEAFYRDMGQCPKGYSLDRRDPAGDYGPHNCRWATANEQANNKTTSRFVTIDGERMTVAQAARRFGIPHWTIHRRLNAGVTIEQILTTSTGVGINNREGNT